jgi:hypothetical protein
MKKTETPSNCPVGTYSDGLGLNGDWECAQCMHGKYCDAPGMDFAAMDAKDCLAGKYCTYGTSDPNAAPDCDYGKFCPLGSMDQTPCEPGQYQDTQGQDHCEPCENGYYCSFEYSLASGNSQRHACDTGYKCDDTSLKSPTPCSAGYYQNVA